MLVLSSVPLKQLKFLSVNVWIKKICVCVCIVYAYYIYVYIYIYDTYTYIPLYIFIKEYYSALKEKEISPLAATWMDSEGIILSKISQRRQICMFSLTCKI